VQAFLGHSSLNTTKIYLRMVPGRLKEEYKKAMPEIAVGVGS
jgi:site-specific recombinase XerD